MSAPTPNRATESADRAVSRAEGGFSLDMQLFTSTGPTCVDDITVGDTVYALNPDTKMVKLKPIDRIEQVTPHHPLVAIECLRAHLHVSANQPVYYQTKSIDRLRVVAAHDLPERAYYRFPTDWRTTPGQHLSTVDITDLTDTYEARLWSEVHGSTVRAGLPDGCEPVRRNSHTGYYFDSTTFKRHQDVIETVADTVEICGGPNTWGRPYRFDGSDFLRLLGWFITEGSIHWSSHKATAEVKFAQKTDRYRRVLQSLFDRLGISVSVSPDGFTFSSTVYAELFERLCGATSADRHLPWFVWDLSLAQKRVLLDTLLAGDGTESGVYYTASEQLASDVLRLAADLGITPRYTQRPGAYRVSVTRTRGGFRSETHVHRRPAPTSLVRLTVRDFPAVLAGRDGKFQWIGVSRIS